MDQPETTTGLNDQSGMKNYTTQYEWFFPYVPKTLSDGRLTWTYEVTLTASPLADEEREQVLARFRQRFDRLSQTMQELEGYEVTDQLVWRCLALTSVQMQQAFFELEHVAFHLMANGVDLRRDLIRLHELLQKWWAMPSLPDMVAYYQLPARLANPDDGSLNMALSISGRAQCLVDGWTYQVDWNSPEHTGVLTITLSPEVIPISGTTTANPIIKRLASEEERERALYEPSGDYPPVSRQQGWIPRW